MNNYILTNWIDEMDKFLKSYNLPRLNYEEIKNLNVPITSKKIDSLIKKLPKKKTPGTLGFPGEFYQIFKKNLHQFSSNASKKLKRQTRQTTRTGTEP